MHGVTHTDLDQRSPIEAASKARHRERGFTLIELLIVIAILGLLVSFVAPAALRQLGGAKQKVAQQSIERLTTILDLYRLDVGTYPTTEQGLGALVVPPTGASNWHGPYLKGDKLPEDPWGHPFLYTVPSTRQGRDYDLCSAGESGQASIGGHGAICN